MQQTLATITGPGQTLEHTENLPAAEGLRIAHTADNRHLFNAAIAFVGLLAAIGLARKPYLFDRPVSAFINQFAHRSPSLDLVFWSLDGCFIFSGFALAALIWYCWFGSTQEDSRARILMGTLLAFPIGAVSRLLQHAVPSHPRPFYDPALHFRMPYLMQEHQLNTWNSFPSDHVTVFAALVTVICIARPSLTKFVIPYFVLVESARVYSGAHYPSDLFGGAALGSMVIWLAQRPRMVAIGRRLLRFEIVSPALFYAFAFFFTSRLANLFLEVRTIGSYFFHIHHH